MDAPALAAACRLELDLGAGARRCYYSLPALEGFTGARVARLPVVLRIVLESLLRNCDGRTVLEEHVLETARWRPGGAGGSEIPFVVGRVVLNCAAGIPLLGDLAAMRAELARRGGVPARVEPQVPVDMTLDHTLTVDCHGSPDALARNMELEIERNRERFGFVKWAMGAFRGIRLVPPGFGILHQLNLEYFAPGLLERDGVCFPDTLVGTDSHTGMIAGLGTVGWGVGGIEAEAAMLGEPLYLATPEVVGVEVKGELHPGVTATDLVLYVTETLRRAQVVGKFVEFFGEGVARLAVPDRATIANMAPEYGATIGYFPVDEHTLDYLRGTGRSESCVAAVERYYRAQGCFGAPRPGEVDYSQVLTLDLGAVGACVAGPRRPQERIALEELKPAFEAILTRPVSEGGYGRGAVRRDCAERGAHELRDGDVVIAAITSCTNTSNPGVMVGAGLLARNAFERGLRPKPWVKTSAAPGSRVVTRYLEAAGLQRFLEALGFAVVGYSCTTCVGASGPLDPAVERAIAERDLVACAVLSGNRNFEARIHPAVRAAFLASPPLVVAFALAGRVSIDFAREPLGHDRGGRPVYLREIWPAPGEIEQVAAAALDPAHYRAVYRSDFAAANPLWGAIEHERGPLFAWKPDSTYLREPPFLARPELARSSLQSVHGARALAILGDSITTDHISPIGTISPSSPAGVYLQGLGVAPAQFNNYGARRLNHEVMARGAFANPRLRNFMVPDLEGGFTVHHPSGERMSIYDAAMRYAREGVPLVVVAGMEYGTGSARDWAAKGPRLLGVSAVIAGSFERIHRSNLVGMGVLPCQLPAGVSARSFRLRGDELFDLLGLDEGARPRQPLALRIRRAGGALETVALTLRADTAAEIEYLRCGGILPYVFSRLAS